MKGTVTVVEIKCPKCGYIQTIEGGRKILDREFQNAASVGITEDLESRLPLRQYFEKSKEER
jgi:hypothetical protein